MVRDGRGRGASMDVRGHQGDVCGNGFVLYLGYSGGCTSVHVLK